MSLVVAQVRHVVLAFVPGMVEPVAEPCCCIAFVFVGVVILLSSTMSCHSMTFEGHPCMYRFCFCWCCNGTLFSGSSMY